MHSNMLYNSRMYECYWITQSILLIVSFTGSAFSNQRRALSMSIPGDIMLVGLFPVHLKERNECGQLLPDQGIQRLEAMLYSLDIINKNNSILPNITLGATIFDTCSTSAHALKLVMDFIRRSASFNDPTKSQCSLTGSDSATRTGGVAAVVGASYSDVSLPLASLLRLFKIPQVSYASTSPWLSDKAKYDYFVRTVPSGQFQSRVLVDIVTYFNWSYVSTVASEGEFGEAGIEFFQQEARRRGICLAETLKVPAYHTDKDIDVVIDKLLGKRNARVVVIYAHGEYILEILNAATRRNLQGHFTWLACDSWGSRSVTVGENHEIAEGALTVVSDVAEISEFNDYFLGLDPLQYTRNPWFQEYWAWSHACQWEESGVPLTNVSDTCTGNETVSIEDHIPDAKVQFVYDAMLTVAMAIDAFIKNECLGSFKECDAATKIDGEKLLHDYILKSNFGDGYGRVVEFDKNGDTFGNYLVINYQFNKTSNTYVNKVVGTWRSSLTVDIGAISWAGGSTKIPMSSCSQSCEPHEIKEMGEDGDTCCWVCLPCKPWQYLANESACADCAQGLWPHPNRRSCYALPLQHMTFDTVYALIPLVLSAFGALITIFIIIIFVCYNNTPVVMATGRELSYLMLSGCLFCYLMTVVLILKPSTLVFAAQRFSVGVSLTPIYSSLLTKTYRISRMFENSKTSMTKASFISQKSQLAVCLALLTLELVFDAIWLLLKPPGTRLHYEGGKRDAVVLKCLAGDVTFLVSLVYNALLIATCTVYAIKTRNVPDNFNESKFIGFAMYTTCVIWVAFVPIYFGTMNSFKLQWSVLCICTSLCATVVLVCLFTPKIFIILLRPHRNVRTQAATLQTTCSVVPPNVEYLSEDVRL